MMIRYGRPNFTGRNLLLAAAFMIGALFGMLTTPSRADERYIPLTRAVLLSEMQDARTNVRDIPVRLHQGGASGEERHFMLPWQMRQMLRARGFHRVEFARQRGPFVSATAFDWQGAPVRLKLNGFTGQILAIARLPEMPQNRPLTGRRS